MEAPMRGRLCGAAYYYFRGEKVGNKLVAAILRLRLENNKGVRGLSTWRLTNSSSPMRWFKMSVLSARTSLGNAELRVGMWRLSSWPSDSGGREESRGVKRDKGARDKALGSRSEARSRAAQSETRVRRRERAAGRARVGVRGFGARRRKLIASVSLSLSLYLSFSVRSCCEPSLDNAETEESIRRSVAGALSSSVSGATLRGLLPYFPPFLLSDTLLGSSSPLAPHFSSCAFISALWPVVQCICANNVRFWYFRRSGVLFLIVERTVNSASFTFFIQFLFIY